MARIITIDSWNGRDLFVPGTDPARIIADGNAWLAKESWDLGAEEGVTFVITTPTEDIRIGWYRVNPCSDTCPCGERYVGHWVSTDGPTRGGFQGAMVAYGLPRKTAEAAA
jgi:hypothetical protein